MSEKPYTAIDRLHEYHKNNPSPLVELDRVKKQLEVAKRVIKGVGAMACQRSIFSIVEITDQAIKEIEAME